MADSYEIPIYLKPVQGDGGDEFLPMQPASDGGGGQDEAQKHADVRSKSNSGAAKAIMTRMARQTLSTALSNYGSLFGDYVSGKNMQTAVNEVTALAGAVAMGPAGIAIYAMDKGFQLYNYIAGLKRSEAEAAFKQQRVYAANRRS